MGAWATSHAAVGKTPQEAYDRAYADAEAEYGHQEGYSGAINSKAPGFSLVELPPRFTYEKLARLIGEYDHAHAEMEWAKHEVETWTAAGRARGAKGKLRKAEATLKRTRARFARVEAEAAAIPNFGGLVEAYNDKWGPLLAVELRPAEAKRRYGRIARRRGEKVYVFFGYAPS